METNNDTSSSPLELKMELYSIVLSVTTLCLAVLFGSGGNITVFFSLCTYKLLAKLRYVLLASLLVVSFIFDVVWCPMEIYRLLHHQHSDQDMDVILKYTEQSLYLFLIATITSILLVICIHNMFLISDKFNYISRYLFAIFAILISVIFMFGSAIGYGLLSFIQEKNTSDETSYHILNGKSFLFRVVILSVWIVLLFFTIIILITFFTVNRKKQDKREVEVCSEYSEPPTPERLNIPTLLIKGAEEENDENNEENDNEEKDKNKSPRSSQKNLASSSSHLKEDNTSTLGDLPSPSRTKNHHLGVNMAAILGRRRHTIGQIGTTGLEVMEKAKQYNYVRKFSVDIQALQAQLENPKIHGGNFPFRSDTELQKSAQNEKKDAIFPRRPLTPTLNLRSNQPEIEEENDKAEQSDEENEEENEEKTDTERRNSSYETMSPPIITLSETTADDMRGRSEKGPNSIKLCCLLVITFICCLLPMFITDTVRNYLSRTAYINIFTCTMALSVIQTIIYPHILFCMDSDIHRAVQKFFGKFHGHLMQICYGRHEVPTTDHIDITVTQV